METLEPTSIEGPDGMIVALPAPRKFFALCVLDDDGEPVPCDIHTYMEWMLTHGGEVAVRRDGPGRVAETLIHGDVRVSTVCLFVNHGFGLTQDLWFETMVFGGVNDDTCRRYATRREAAAGHEEVVQSLLAARALPEGSGE